MNLGSRTRSHPPPAVSQRAYCRERSPIRYSIVHICGAFVPQARSRPWQVVKPQVERPGVSDGTVVASGVGIVVGTGVGVTFPSEVSVQPAVMSAATSRRPHIPGIMAGCFMNNHICRDIRRGLYLWVYFTAKILGVIVVSGSIPLLIRCCWWGLPVTEIIFHRSDQNPV